MLEEEGVVLEINNGLAEVLTQRKSACGSCAAKNGCGTSLVESLFPQRSRAFLAKNEVGAKEGDQVILGLDEAALQMASLLVYLVPILGLIAGAMLGTWLGSKLATGYVEILSILGGSGGFFVSLSVVRHYSDALSGKHEYQAQILRVIPRERIVVSDIELQGMSKG
ncbi:SoxR reducing system RseC family protein [Thiolapillus brandeum]|uniref:Sigma-E factor negative regulatory protein RseC n=1 Tax=Thiolapillus brandeum TaxID=1076588 RepID=A0A7U6GI58_9GAMM|nr:SoxR reducing system RseC family protein [Thiolapillus brandeum]BAO44052.1 sigma-E factor negative regulatory protein RseC [Thiolapillus brandeum]